MPRGPTKLREAIIINNPLLEVNLVIPRVLVSALQNYGVWRDPLSEVQSGVADLSALEATRNYC